MEQYAPFIRIALRYLSAVLVAKGVAGADILANDPDIYAALMTVIGAAIAGFNEAWYWAARRYGWEK